MIKINYDDTIIIDPGYKDIPAIASWAWYGCARGILLVQENTLVIANGYYYTHNELLRSVNEEARNISEVIITSVENNIVCLVCKSSVLEQYRKKYAILINRICKLVKADNSRICTLLEIDGEIVDTLFMLINKKQRENYKHY